MVLPLSVVTPLTVKFPVTLVSFNSCIVPVPLGLIPMSALVELLEIVLFLKSSISILILPDPLALSSRLALDSML